MQIIPAIDLRGGKCVRLRQGDYAQETVFSADPVETARRWVEQGAQRLHIVDLDGARNGELVHRDAVQSIVKAAGMPCQLGGGIRNEEDLRLGFYLGADRLVIGTKALQSPDWLRWMTLKYPDRLLLGIDARDGMVATEGWTATSTTPALELAKQFAHLPLAGLIYTDIARDGMMAGPNLEAMKSMAESVPLPVIASGGVSSLDDIRALAKLPLDAVIVGRALYEDKIDLPEAIQLLKAKV